MSSRIKNILPEELITLIWKQYYSIYIVKNIVTHANKINKYNINPDIHIYTINYNVLRIMSGMNGFVYST
jgi:hypothetical protein